MIEKARENAALRETVINRPSAEGDLVDIRILCYKAEEYGKGGAQIDIISDENCSLIIGAGKYPTELERSLQNRYAGDTFTVRLTLPESYTVAGLAGTNTVFEIEVKTVTEFRLPLYNDAFVKSVSGCNTVEEYENELFKVAKEDLVWEAILRKSEIKRYPETELNAHIVDYVTYYTDIATKSEMTLEHYVGKKFFISLTDFHKEADIYAKDSVKKELLLYYFERAYNLTLSDIEYNNAAKQYANEYGLDSIAELEAKFGSEYVKKTVHYDKVLAFLAENIKIIEDIV